MIVFLVFSPGQVKYNRAYALSKMNRIAEAEHELREAKTMAADFTESRHKIISSALDKIRVRVCVSSVCVCERVMASLFCH